MDHFLQTIYGFVFVILFFSLILWWLPAAVYYALGLYFISTMRRKPRRAAIWLSTFVLMFAYTAYEGIYLRSQLQKRAELYHDVATFAEPPADVARSWYLGRPRLHG